MLDALDYVRLEALMLALDSHASDCRQKISAMRRAMDQACDDRTITLRQWRGLLEKVSILQARCSESQPDAWRHPSLLPRDADAP